MDILILDGDGIGPEIAAASATVLEHVNDQFALGLTIERRALGLKTLDREGTTLPDSVKRLLETLAAAAKVGNADALCPEMSEAAE